MSKKKQRIRKGHLAVLLGAVLGLTLVIILFIWMVDWQVSMAQTGFGEDLIIQKQSIEKTESEIQADKAAQETASRIDRINRTTATTPVDITGLNDEQLRSCFTSSVMSQELASRLDQDQFDLNQSFILPENLRLVRILYVNFDGNTCPGEIIVHESIAEDVENIFWELYLNKYPIGRVEIPYGYGMDDNAVMTDNITRSMCFTWDENGNPLYHEHSMGLAIDFNSFYNPQVITENGQYIVLPPTAEEYADRSVIRDHMLYEEDLAVQIFKKYGFNWGGEWTGRNDYQHFEKYFNHVTGSFDPSVHS